MEQPVRLPTTHSASCFRSATRAGSDIRAARCAERSKLCVLYTSGAETDWPDRLNVETGAFEYFGDNRHPGSGLLETRRRGNLLLQDTFARSHEGPESRASIPPYLLFEKADVRGRDVVFRGLLAPGSPRLSPEEELVAVWRTTAGRRFQNYRAHFTVLAVDRVSRAWIDELLRRERPLGAHCPPQWRAYVESRAFVRACGTADRRDSSAARAASNLDARAGGAQIDLPPLLR